MKCETDKHVGENCEHIEFAGAFPKHKPVFSELTRRKRWIPKKWYAQTIYINIDYEHKHKHQQKKVTLNQHEQRH